MTAADERTRQYPFNKQEGLDLDPAYRAARETPGMIRVQMPFGEPAWLATRYEDARFVLGDRRFSRALATTSDEPRTQSYQRAGGILAMDPPDHTRLRVLIASAFTVRRVEKLRPRVRELAEGLLRDMVAAGAPADLVDAFALPLPVQVICELLGVPAEDRHLFRAWSDALLSTSSLTLEEYQRNDSELRAYIAGLVALRRAEPADDLMSALIAARAEDEDRLSETELVELCVAVLVAGHETTATQIPNFAHVLLANPDRLAQLRADPGLIPAAVEELLRFIPLGAGSAFARYATEDVQVGEVLVRAGEPVLAAIGSANHDDARFPAADTLRFDREETSHLGFGHGVHHCLGAPLARLELQEALRALVTLDGLREASEPVWKTQMLVRGPRSMPVAW
ncbi:cytochrome P450 [Actinokineospora sp. NBRC 105648]|uniref:cytochrome P450 n=1 Tax=Actinokineospora sp. NBRC 105648 TaxID=3032206 RepID=UPI0024A2EFDE|nr:cytochrome P450 [Actinokineospora sp. NBRC 105648]GLZ38855.1 cytochrome P450 [Actinokineospora sp. NBRC 105648]